MVRGVADTNMCSVRSGSLWRAGVRRAALPHELLVPRRGQPSRGAGRRGRPPGPRRPRRHRPRRPLRRGALRARRPRRRAAHRVRRRAHARRARTPPNGDADPPGEHLVVLAEGPVGYARLARAVSAAQLAGRRARPASTSTPSPAPPRAQFTSPLRGERAQRLVVRAHRVPQGRGAARRCSTTARRGPARPRPARRRLRARPRAGGAVGPRRPARPAPQRRARRSMRVRRRRRGRHQQRALRHARASDRSPPRSPPSVPGARSTRSTAGCRRRRSRTCAARPSSNAGSRAGPARSSARSRSRRRARSTSGSRRPSCPTTTCRPVTPR